MINKYFERPASEKFPDVMRFFSDKGFFIVE